MEKLKKGRRKTTGYFCGKLYVIEYSVAKKTNFMPSSILE